MKLYPMFTIKFNTSCSVIGNCFRLSLYPAIMVQHNIIRHCGTACMVWQLNNSQKLNPKHLGSCLWIRWHDLKCLPLHPFLNPEAPQQAVLEGISYFEEFYYAKGLREEVWDVEHSEVDRGWKNEILSINK